MDHKKIKKYKKTASLVFLWSMIVIILFPIVYMVLLSGAESQNISAGREFDDLTHFGRNYVEMQTNINFFGYFKNSVIVVGISTLISLALATCAGYALARYKFPGSNLFGLTMLGTQLIPPTMTLIPMYLIFIAIQNYLGMQFVDSYKGMIIPYVAIFTPGSIWIIRGFFATIPVELEEAARIDGCSKFQAFYKIILPLSLPGILATGISTFLAGWDELMIASVLTTTATYQTIPVGIRLFIGNMQNRYDLTMAASVVTTLPVLIIFFLLQKHFIQGMTQGAVKG